MKNTISEKNSLNGLHNEWDIAEEISELEYIDRKYRKWIPNGKKEKD